MTAVNLQNTNDVGYSVVSSQSAAEAENVSITFTVAKKDGTSNVELSYVDSGTVKYGFMKNGIDLETIAWDGDNTDHILIGEYDVTAELGTATEGQKAYLNGKSYTFALSAQGNVQILDYHTSVNVKTKTDFTNGNAKDAAENPTVTITFGAAGAITNYAISNPYYVVRTNNPTGLEWDAENDTTSAHTSAYHTLDKIIVTAAQTIANS